MISKQVEALEACEAYLDRLVEALCPESDEHATLLAQVRDALVYGRGYSEASDPPTVIPAEAVNAVTIDDGQDRLATLGFRFLRKSRTILQQAWVSYDDPSDIVWRDVPAVDENRKGRSDR